MSKHRGDLGDIDEINDFPKCPKDNAILSGRIYCQNCTEIENL